MSVPNPHRSRWRRGLLLGATSIACFGAGVAMTPEYARRAGVELASSDVVYRSLQLFTLSYPAIDGARMPWALDVARFLAPLLTLTTVLATMHAVLRDQADRFVATRWRNHTVVVGSSRLARALVRSYHPATSRVVLISDELPVDAVHEVRRMGARAVSGPAGSRTSERIMEGASALVAVGETDPASLRWAAAAAALRDPPRRISAVVRSHDIAALADVTAGGSTSVHSLAARIASAALSVEPPRRPPRGPLRPVLVCDGPMWEAFADVISSGFAEPSEDVVVHAVGPLTAVVRSRVSVHACAATDVGATVAQVVDAARTRGVPIAEPLYVWMSSVDDAFAAARQLRDHVQLPICIISDDDVVPVPHPHTQRSTSISFLGTTSLASTGLLVARFDDAALAAYLYADHQRFGRFPDTDGEHMFGQPPAARWDELGAAELRRYGAVAAAIPVLLADLGIVLSPAASHDARSATFELTPAELRRLAAGLADLAGAPWHALPPTPAGVIGNAAAIDLAHRLPTTLALAGVVGTRTRPGVTISAEHVDEIATEVHRLYLAHERERAVGRQQNAALVPWAMLDEGLKEANREQVRDIVCKVAAVGGELRRGGRSEGWPTSGPLVEALAELEHRRWCRTLRARGFVFGAGTKDMERRTHPDLVPYASLAPATVGAPDPREKDRDAVRTIPSLLESVGLSVSVPVSAT